MSNYYDLDYCSNCVQMTNHLFADDTPRQHEYTKICQKCGKRTELSNGVIAEVPIENNKTDELE